jgi:hypothetical protein
MILDAVFLCNQCHKIILNTLHKKWVRHQSLSQLQCRIRFAISKNTLVLEPSIYFYLVDGCHMKRCISKYLYLGFPVIMGACVRGFYVPYVADELHCCTYRAAIFYVGIATTWHIPASGKTTVEGIFTTDEHTAQKSARGLTPSSLSFRLLPLSIVVLFLKPLANPMVCFAWRSAVGPS